MKTSEAGKEFIKSFESCRLAAYDDGVGIWTIGYGHVKGVQRGDECTQAQADAWFEQDDLMPAEECVNSLITASLSQQQYDAVVSLVFNIGCGNLSTSTIRKMLNARDYNGAAGQFIRWNKAGNPLRELAGLTKRRNAERKMFETGVYENHV